ncbi:MAG: nucleotide exchange factor GrpE [Chloroflexota bacterium]
MTEETPIDRTPDHETGESAPDDRFEVKWRKKSEATPRADTPPAPQAENEDIDAVRRELEAERQRSSDLHDRWQRAAADLVNLRKRTEQEQDEREKFASMVLVFELLPALDNFERAFASIPDNLRMFTWIQGVMLIQRQLQAILEHQGLAAIEVDGQPFNPSLHEAIGERETADSPSGTIVQEYQRGYTMHGRVIRPALVEVAKAPNVAEQVATAPVSAPDTDTSATGAQPADAPSEAGVAEQTKTENTGP